MSDIKPSSSKFTPEELNKLEAFRARVGAIYPECNENLIRWLRAREMDLDKAEIMLRRHLVWRRNNEMEKLLDWKSPKVFFPYIPLDLDYEGAPVFLLPFGHWDLRSCIETGDMIPALRFIYQTLEVMTSTGNEIGIYEGVVIVDFEGFEYRQIAHASVVQGMIEVLRVFESNYPEVLKHAFVINAPKIFNILFAIIKPVLHSRTLGKIQIYNNDRQKWLNVLLKIMPSDVLPKYWGGTRPGCDDFCSDSWFQEPLPRYYMRKIASNFDENGDEWYTIKISAKECLTFEYLVDDFGPNGKLMDSVLKWRFCTESYDIGFAICHQDESRFLIEYERVNAHEERQEGSVKLDKPGTYVLQFDNSYSLSRSKVIHYCIAFTTVEIPSSTGALQKRQKKKCSIGHETLNLDDGPPRSSMNGDVEGEDHDEHYHDHTHENANGNGSDKQMLVTANPMSTVAFGKGFAALKNKASKSKFLDNS